MFKVIDYTKEHTFLLLMIIKQGGMQSLSALAPEKGRGPRKWEGPTVTACHLVYVIIIRLLYKVNPSERILDVTLLELSDEVIEPE